LKIFFDVSTTNYEENKELLIKALDYLQNRCEIVNGYQLGKPVSRFGWTFFKLWLKPNLVLKIEEKLSDMIKKTKGKKHEEKFTNFMSDYFLSKGCNVKLKLTENED